MSVTFICPGAPSHQVPCRWCAEYAANDPDMLTENGRCDQWCRGTEERNEEPRVNWSNVSAGGVLRMLDLYDPEGPWGELTVEEIPAVLQRLVGLINRRSSRDHLVRGFRDERAHEPRIKEDPDTGLPTITQGARFIDAGNTDNQTLRRLTHLQELLVWAVEHNLPVSWG